MFLRRIVIENYRNYLHTEIELTEGLNVIVGPNNSGKSNLLNVINFLSSNSLKEKKFSVDDINKNDLFSNYAKYLTEPPQIKITYDIEHIMNLYIHVKSDQQQFIKVEKALAAYSKSIGLGELFYEVIDLNT